MKRHVDGLRRSSVLGGLVLIGLFFSGVCAREERPNVLLIMTDDQGWGDLHSHGNEKLDTPNMDRLAAGGVRFDRFFVSPLCAPTRAALLTGRDHLRTGVTSVARRWEVMRSEEVTLGEMFRQAGYATGCFGKWHSGSNYPHRPVDQGFEEFVGFYGGAHHEYFDPLLRHNDSVERYRGHITEILTDQAIRFMRQSGERPFFCYLPYNAPHTPRQVPDALFEKYVARGFSAKTAGIYAMVEQIDTQLGRLLASLRHLGIADETIVLFLTDNGPNGDRYNGGMRGRKGSVDEGGSRVPCFLRWKGHLDENVEVKTIAAHFDLMPTLAALCDVAVPEDHLPLSGRSLVPLFGGTVPEDWPDRKLFTNNSRGEPTLARGAVRTQRYRLVIPRNGESRLFDMVDDPSQRRNLASTKPEVAEELSLAYEAWFEEASRRSQCRRPIHVHFERSGSVELASPDAVLHGETFHFPAGPGWTYDWIAPRDTEYLTDWSDPEEFLEWELLVEEGGTFDVFLRYACAEEDLGATLRLSVDGEQVIAKRLDRPFDTGIVERPDRDPDSRRPMREFLEISFGTIVLPEGEVDLTLEAVEIPGRTACHLRGLRLVPAEP